MSTPKFKKERLDQMHEVTSGYVSRSEMFFGDITSSGFGRAVDIKRGNLYNNPGRFGWDGGLGTSAYSDPAEDFVGILLTQKMLDSPDGPAVFKDFWTSAYQAIV